MTKIEKNSKYQSQIAACETKPQARKQIFVQIPFCHSTLKLERKNFTPQNHSLFRYTPCFGVIKSSLQFDFKNHKMV